MVFQPIIANATTLKEAATHLSQADPILAPLVRVHGLAPFTPHQNYYQALVDSIIGQQLSVHAARAIKQRFRDLFDNNFPAPEQIVATDVETLRGIGFSRQKASYIIDLAQRILDGTVRFDNLDHKTNQEIIDELIAVKGIGEWTVHMFLMFCMGRLDILAYGDLGVRNGIKALYGLTEMPDQAAIKTLVCQNDWHPYESVACWYIWQSLNNQPV